MVSSNGHLFRRSDFRPAWVIAQRMTSQGSGGPLADGLRYVAIISPILGGIVLCKVSVQCCANHPGKGTGSAGVRTSSSSTLLLLCW